MGVKDEPTEIRKGEELDAKKIEEFLKDALPHLTGEVVLRQFPRGHSNLTYSIRVGDTELILRRPPFGRKAKTAHDMLREYRILEAIHPVFPYSPKPLVYSDDPSVMDCPFYVMERLEGIILRRDLPEGLHFPPQDAKKLCENFIDLFCQLHAIDYQEIGLEDFGKPAGYVRRQVEGWSRRYRDARTPDAPDYEPVMEWLHEHMPEDTDSPTIIHNDFKLDNVVLDPDNPLNIIGVLDWEMATIGDPLMDLGGSLAYWVEAGDSENMKLIRMMPTTMEGMLTRKELIVRYEKRSNRTVALFDFYYCFGLFRLAGIAQQIYYRYYHKQTEDERFKMFIYAVRFLEETAQAVIQQSEL
jgi:aminoglycoside phosphotransferase (APT) family kinase protein